MMEGFGVSLRKEAMLETPTHDIVKSSQIEGVFLDTSLYVRLSQDNWEWTYRD